MQWKFSQPTLLRTNKGTEPQVIYNPIYNGVFGNVYLLALDNNER